MELKIYKAHKICKSLAHGTITTLASAVRSDFCLVENSKKTVPRIAFRGSLLKWLLVMVKSLAHGTITALTSAVRSDFCLVENSKNNLLSNLVSFDKSLKKEKYEKFSKISFCIHTLCIH